MSPVPQVISRFSYKFPPKPVIFGLSGPELTPEEEKFFRAYPPVGFILFARNLASIAQLKELCASLREVIGEEAIPILIDEEGGKVSRLTALSPSYETPWPADLGEIEAVTSHYRKIGRWLKELGLTVNCAPVLDVRTPWTAPFLAKRCFDKDPDRVAVLGSAAIESLKSEGIVPVMKHVPGHGSVRQDSHHEEAIAQGPLSLVPFQANALTCPWAMSCHVHFPSLSQEVTTFSSLIIKKIIRTSIGFQGFLITDDLCMHALSSFSLDVRIRRALEAGHDAVLVCSGDLKEWEKTIPFLPPLSEQSQSRLHAVC